jgi:hypothetical protein
MTFSLKVRNLALGSALLIVLVGTALASPSDPVSGYEIFLGYNCTINGRAATCGTTFSGWTGETDSGGWLAFPGTGQGTWSIRVNYTGQPAFGGSVTLVGGSWRFLFIGETSSFLHGAVVSGTVTWPADQNTDIGCGDGVAVVDANLSVAGGGNATVTGCLHDLPKGSVIPPKVWGTFNF